MLVTANQHAEVTKSNCSPEPERRLAMDASEFWVDQDYHWLPQAGKAWSLGPPAFIRR